MMTPNLSSSFLSFPTQSSPRLSIHLRPSHSSQSQTQTQNQTQQSTHSPTRHFSYPLQRRRPTPIDLYALPTLEALPTPPSTDTQSHISFNSSTEDKPARLRKAPSPSQGEFTGRIMKSFVKKKSEKEKEKEREKTQKKDKKVNTSFLPFDTAPPNSASRRPSVTTQQLPRPPTGMSTRSKPRPAPLDPAIFGHRLQVVRAEDPIDMVLRLDSEARVQAITRSFSPFGADQAAPPRPPPLDPSVFGRMEMKVVRSEDPIDTVLRLDEEAKIRAINQSFTPFGDEKSSMLNRVQRSRGQSVGQGPDRPAPRTTESRTGSVRHRSHGPMPSIQGVIEGDGVWTNREKRDTMVLPMMAPPQTAMPLRRSPTSKDFFSNRDQAPSPTSSTPREFFYPRPESPRTNRHVIPGFTNRSPPSHTATIDESPTLGSIHLPEITRYKSLSPSIASRTDSAWLSNTYVDPDEERLTALEILEELNGGMEDGWEYGVLDSQRIQAGLDNRNFKHYGMTTTPYSQPTTIITAGHHKEGTGSIKEVANSVRSWRESRKKVRPPSEKSVKSKTGSLKPKPSYDALQPLYEVHYSVEKSIMNPPPIPPRAPGRSLPPLKIHIERVVSHGSAMSGMEVPIMLDSPVKGKFKRHSTDSIGRHDIPESVILSPPTSPTPIHQRPLPPLPSASPRTRSMKTSLKQADSITRLLRAKKPNGDSPPMFQSTPPSFTEPLSPLDSPPPASPRPRLSAREEPHASLPSRLDQAFSVDRAQSRKHGMTALSFLALEDPINAWAGKTNTTSSVSNRNSLDGKVNMRRESVLAHIIPPEELAKMVSRRRASSDSDHSRSSVMPDYYTEEMDEGGGEKVGRMTLGLSPPPPPRHNRRSFEPPPRVDEEEVLPSSLSPPPRPRHSLSTRRPSDSPSTSSRYDFLNPSPAASPFTTTPSPNQSFIRNNMGAPSPIKESPDRDLFSLTPASELGHASELRQGSHESVSKEMDKQALNEWLSKPRIRKGSVPVQGISRRRGMLV